MDRTIIKVFFVLLLGILFGSMLFITSPESSNKIVNMSNSTITSYTSDVKTVIQQVKSNNHSLVSGAIRPFINLRTNYVVAPKYGLASCLVEKVMSTVAMRVMCFLFDEKGWRRNNISLEGTEWNDDRYCLGRNEWKGARKRDDAMGNTDHETIFIVRDPFERFMSGFIDKCINERRSCFGCKDDILCMTERLYNRLEWASMNSSYLLDLKLTQRNVGESYIISHFAPQTWSCELSEEFERYRFVKNEEGLSQNETVRSFLQILIDHNVGLDEIEYVSSALQGGTSHATKKSDVRSQHEDILRRSPKHHELIRKMFYYDYVIFNFNSSI